MVEDLFDNIYCPLLRAGVPWLAGFTRRFLAVGEERQREERKIADL
jgi:hypothetical protein